MTETTTTITAADFGLTETDPRWLKIKHAEERITAETPSVIPPCPSWCAWQGHDYDSTDTVIEGEPVTYIRSHSSRRNEAQASVTQLEKNRAGLLIFGMEEVFVSPNSEDMDADAARSLAADVLEAADLLEDLRTR
jgi:hypothetical protein